ncbi:ATP synthase F0 subcomplex A subunit [Ruaniaceae bacterium KH17]|nr:ATP synthase F0 subcomplex A subunit [Ruaniaceae bacterium KH17]
MSVAGLALGRMLVPFAAEGDGGFHAPTIEDMFPPAIFGAGTPFEFNRIMMVRVIATLVLCLLFWLASRNLKLVPGRGQATAEFALGFVRTNIAEEVLGKESGKRWTPLLTIIFFSVLALNITGVIPFLNIAGSSVVGFPLVMALIAWVAFIYAGIKSHGAGHFFKDALFPPGVPWPLYFILAPIELISTFILRPATLTIRLLANMMAGHFLLVLCFSATNALFLYAAVYLKPLGLLTGIMGTAFIALEIFIAALQAYIFALLTAVYISLSEEGH